MADGQTDGTNAVPKSARLAVLRFAYGEGPPTYNLIIGSLCDRLHQLPEAIERSGIVRLMQITGEVDLLTAIQKMQSGQSISHEAHDEIGELMKADLEKQKRAKV